MTGFQVFLAVGMLVTGSLNTLSTSWADKLHAAGTMHPSTVWDHLQNQTEERHAFNHPYFQAVCMFIGEGLCMLAHLVQGAVRGRRSARDVQVLEAPASPANRQGSLRGNFWFMVPAMCDMCGTGTMYAGLCLSYASVFQMLRGSVVIFTAAISYMFLGRKQTPFQLFSILLIVIGVTVVGIVSLGEGGKGGNAKSASAVMVGNILIVLAQIITAVQMCVEENIMSKYDTPALKAVGLEGCFGFVILGSLLVPMYFIHIEGYPFENAPDALAQLGNNPTIIAAMVGNILSIAFFNFFGISITKSMSASHRMVLDSVRTCVVWGMSLALKWEHFSWLQLVGFVILTLGTAAYNEIVRLPGFAYSTQVRVVEADQPLNAEKTVDEA